MKPGAGKSRVFAANTYNRAKLSPSMALALSGKLKSVQGISSRGS